MNRQIAAAREEQRQDACNPSTLPRKRGKSNLGPVTLQRNCLLGIRERFFVLLQRRKRGGPVAEQHMVAAIHGDSLREALHSRREISCSKGLVARIL